MFNFNNITEYQFEITTYCNAACPQCPRNVQGAGINPYMPLVHLSRDAVDAAFSVDHCKALRQIFFCGSYGDPIMHPEFLDLLQDFRCKNPTLWLYVHTNGGIHDESYWAEIATIMNGYGQIDFGFDGLEDTLHLYRRSVKYNVAMRNARAYINAGGRAQWNYIVFKHNEHQVEQARQLSQEYGFFNFLARKTGRFYDHANEVAEERDEYIKKYDDLLVNFKDLDRYNDVLYRLYHAARRLRNSGYDGPFIGEVTEELYSCIAGVERYERELVETRKKTNSSN